ncbi:glutamyl-tRNA reductase [Candidatus Cyanaurora vandensis]|uniref:glutamyl-tRNA reductase n=1 Tax=Candidatus Cyanaurora vandensis TaxID=2714958 RepID=UPI00257BF6BE|nr:glutamyl-tRNA reductase [Candidatus Cyanaurora vandensis]
MYLAVVGLSHRTASVEIRECLTIANEELTATLQGCLAACTHVQEVAILNTCNRLEVYVVVTDTEHGVREVIHYLSRLKQVALPTLQTHLFTLLHEDAVIHLFRVAAGLDSMVLGEGQVLAQVKSTYQQAQQARTTGRFLNELFKTAIGAGKRVRTDTEIGTGAVSISSAAVELAHAKFAGLKGRHNLVVGAGDMGELFVRHLIAKGADRITILNRSLDRAEKLASQFPQPIAVLPWEKLVIAVTEADLVFTSTATQEPILARRHLEHLELGSRTLTFFDIGMPRNVAPDVNQVPGVWSYNVDDLKEVVDRNLAHRQQMVQQAQLLLEEDATKFTEWWGYTQDAVPTLNSFRQKVESIRLAELEKALSRLGNEFAGKHQEVIDSLTRAIVNKILHDPVLRIRAEQDVQARRQAMQALQTLFNLENPQN